MTPEELADAVLGSTPYRSIRPIVIQAIREAVADEREACARVADSYRIPENDVARLDGRGDEADAIAEEIRARGTPAPSPSGPTTV